MRTGDAAVPLIPLPLGPCIEMCEMGESMDGEYQGKMLREPGVQEVKEVRALRFRRGDVYLAVPVAGVARTKVVSPVTRKLDSVPSNGTTQLQLVWLLGLQRFAFISTPCDEINPGRTALIPWTKREVGMALVKGDPLASGTEPIELDIVDQEGVLMEGVGWHPERGFLHAESADFLDINGYWYDRVKDEKYGWKAGRVPPAYIKPIGRGPGFNPGLSPRE